MFITFNYGNMIKKEWLFMQTPKEKAYNLYKKFYNIDGQDFRYTMSSKIAKQCAKLHISLILENEILKPSNNIEYYQEVLKEIEKL
tara:strand:- start:239 stop:496 length:258 start_codon:yes stop_codon:yes gene_type:complete